jgi:hypothetical protein
MIRYRLKCEKRHEFEAWFASSAAFERQVKRGQVSCPRCGTVKVNKTLMAPSIIKGARRARAGKAAETAPEKAPETSPETAPETSQGPAAAQAAPPQPETHRLAAHGDLASAMRKLRAEIESKSEYVGPRFPEEARKIHYEEAPARGIYGEATREEAQALSEEGIEFFPLPSLPEDHN